MTDFKTLNNKIAELETKVAELEEKKKNDMNQHVECELCHKIFKNRYILRTHVKNIHCEKRESFECPHCHKHLKSKYYLKSHILLKHSSNEQ